MEQIKMVDLSSQYQRIRPEIDQAIEEVLISTQFIQGKEVKEFESELSDYLKVRGVVSCGNGTDALQIALMSLGLTPGDEIIIPVFTYIASAEVVALLNLKPVFVDVEEDYFGMAVDQLEAKITKRTRAIIVVHLFGQCSNMEVALEIAKKYDLFVIEDNAQAIGATYRFNNGTNSYSGTLGHIGCFSFFPSKNLGCFGDGGAIVSNDENLLMKIRMIANHGQKQKYHHDIIGCNSRLDTLQAAILRVKLKHLESYIESRNEVAKWYDNFFENIEEVVVPQRAPYSTHVFHQYTVQVKKIDRNKIKELLRQEGIPSMVYYPMPLHLQGAFTYMEYERGDFPISEKLSGCVLSLPMHTELDYVQTQFIVQHISEVINQLK